MSNRLLAAAVALLLSGCAAAPTPLPSAPPAPRAAGRLLLVGGGRQPPELVRHFVELAGGPGRARIAILPMASTSPALAGESKAEELRGLGAEVRVLHLSRAQADTDSAASLLEGVTGIWFPGGDQGRLAAALNGTRTAEAIVRRYREGAVVGGTSAGASIMSDSMLTGAQLREGADTASYQGDDWPRVARGYVQIRPGLGLLRGVVVDQHFLRRERQNRLLSVVLERPGMIGVGIDEGTALQVDPDGSWQVHGSSAVLIFDARRARVTPGTAPALGAAGVRTHLLPAGSRFQPAAGEPLLPEG